LKTNKNNRKAKAKSPLRSFSYEEIIRELYRLQKLTDKRVQRQEYMRRWRENRHQA
jgi:hypothetical protein